MPAAELSRIQAQIKAISTQIDQPAVFVHSLQALLEMYAEHAFQPGNLAKFKILIPSYRVPPLIMHQLEINMPGLAEKNPSQVLEAADLLWKEKYYEVRLMGIILLGNLPVKFAQPVSKRIASWINPDEEKELIKALLSFGSRRLRNEKPELWLHIIQMWIKDENDEIKKIGLQSLISIIIDPEFEDFPKIYSLLEIAIRDPNVTIQKELFLAISQMTDRSPMEMTAFLRNVLIKTQEETVRKFIRRCLPLLEETDQVSLKAIMERPL